tara:strand:- start:6871 stop:7158 length:288 start_codon:yes stop_codon:yes gene_type:complete
MQPTSTPKKPRATRKNYGIKKDSIIRLTDKASQIKMRGNRGKFFDCLKTCNGKTVEEFLKKASVDGGDPPRGWIRFFIQEKICTLVDGSSQRKVA